MVTFETLQDFASHLLNDSQALSAFQADPEGVLQTAGLGDVSALDVQEILPLVLDHSPVQGLGGVFGSLSSDNALDVLDSGALGLPDTSALTGVTATAQQLTSQFSAVTDLGDGLDADVLGGSLDSVNDLTAHAKVTEVVHDITAQSQVTDLVGDLSSGADVLDTTHVTGTVQDITTGLGTGDVLGGDLSGLTGTVTDNALHLGDIAQAGDVLGGVGHVGDVTSALGGVSGIGDISHVADLGHLDVGDVLSDNAIAF
ncbi:IniB N-terminal domain-containing protein [Umezawaea tangerina]|uniref:Uncharacterized protein n=1 Tax=Umezawaea tangerina TaxID=84725 RepID=A0A2T0STG9_9PSEU|nr:IniB N-terminal domain-containing protein [Umezawaea tangerina]PRY36706.1 hypothetical protein CLV43_11178 [Umezawaea tangerina]